MFGCAWAPDAQQGDEDPAEWRGRKTAVQCLHALCLSERLADVWFTFEESDVRLSAHKFVLSMRSEVFENTFRNQPNVTPHAIHFDDIRSDVMKQILKFIYTDHIDVSIDNVFDFLYVAKKYELEILQELCIQRLIKLIETTNVCEIYEKVQGYDLDKRVTTACMEYIWRHAWKVFATEPFLEISRETLAIILKSDCLTGEEIATFRSVMKWAEHKTTSEHLQPTRINIQEVIGEAVYDIRFPLMSTEEFTEEVEPTGVLTANDMSALRRFMKEKDAGLSKEVEKFNCETRNGGVMRERIFNAYPDPDRMSGGCEHTYNLLITTSDDIRLYSMTGPLIKDIGVVKISVHARHEMMYSPPSQEILEKEDNWTPVRFSISQDEELVFTDEPVLMPMAYIYVKIELSRRTPVMEQDDKEDLVAPVPRGRAKRGRRGNRREDFVGARVTNMSLVIKQTTISLSCIPPGITNMSFR